jgi:hypothetical protein
MDEPPDNDYIGENHMVQPPENPILEQEPSYETEVEDSIETERVNSSGIERILLMSSVFCANVNQVIASG